MSFYLGTSWPWSHGSWIYNYLCNQCLSPLKLWVPFSIMARCRTLCYKVCQWLETGRWFSPGPPVSSTNKTDRHDITAILLKVALNSIKQTSKQSFYLAVFGIWAARIKSWTFYSTDPCGIENLPFLFTYRLQIKWWRYCIYWWITLSRHVILFFLYSRGQL